MDLSEAHRGTGAVDTGIDTRFAACEPPDLVVIGGRSEVMAQSSRSREVSNENSRTAESRRRRAWSTKLTD